MGLKKKGGKNNEYQEEEIRGCAKSIIETRAGEQAVVERTGSCCLITKKRSGDVIAGWHVASAPVSRLAGEAELAK